MMKNFFLLLLLLLAYIYAQNYGETSNAFYSDTADLEGSPPTEITSSERHPAVNVSDETFVYIAWPKCRSPWNK